MWTLVITKSGHCDPTAFSQVDTNLLYVSNVFRTLSWIILILYRRIWETGWQWELCTWKLLYYLKRFYSRTFSTLSHFLWFGRSISKEWYEQQKASIIVVVSMRKMGWNKRGDEKLSTCWFFVTKEVFLNIKVVLYYMNVYTTHSLCEVSLKSLGF